MHNDSSAEYQKFRNINDPGELEGYHTAEDYLQDEELDGYHTPDENLQEENLDQYDDLLSINEVIRATLFSKPEPTLYDYITIAHANHSEAIEINYFDLMRNFVPVTACYAGGGTLALIFVPYAELAAKGDPIRAFFFKASTFVTNTAIYGFFASKPVLEFYNKIMCSCQTPGEVQEAINNLKNTDPGWWALICKTVATTFGTAAVLVADIFGSYTNYALDQNTGQHSEELSKIIFVVTVLQQYPGVEALVYDVMIPAIDRSLKAAFRSKDPDEQNLQEIDKFAEILKDAHEEAFQNGYGEYLRSNQIGDLDTIQPVNNLLALPYPKREDTENLIIQWLMLTARSKQPKEQVQSIIRKLLAILFDKKTVLYSSLAITAASLVSSFLVTKESIDKTFEEEPGFYQWLFSIGSFIPQVAVAFKVSWDTFEILHDRASYALEGARKSYYSAGGKFCKFFKNAWNNKGSLAGWSNVILLPRSIQEHPKMMLASLCLSGILAGLSVFPSLNLNEQELDELMTAILNPPTGVSVAIFNGFAFPYILDYLEQFYTCMFGTPEAKLLVKAETFVEKHRETIRNMHPVKIVEMLNGFAAHGSITQKTRDKVIFLWLGKKLTADLLGSNHPYANVPLSAIVSACFKRDLSMIRDYWLRQRPQAELRFRPPATRNSDDIPLQTINSDPNPNGQGQ